MTSNCRQRIAGIMASVGFLLACGCEYRSEKALSNEAIWTGFRRFKVAAIAGTGGRGRLRTVE